MRCETSLETPLCAARRPPLDVTPTARRVCVVVSRLLERDRERHLAAEYAQAMAEAEVDARRATKDLGAGGAQHWHAAQDDDEHSNDSNDDHDDVDAKAPARLGPRLWRFPSY